MGEVIEVHPDSRGLVRTVTLEVITPTEQIQPKAKVSTYSSKMTHWEQPDQNQGEEDKGEPQNSRDKLDSVRTV